MRNKTGIAMLLAAVLLPAPAARAQLLDTLLPADVPGYGQKFSVIAAHRQFAPGATGWNFGGVTATPSLTLQAGYDTAPGGSTGSSTLQANPSLLLADAAAGFGLYAEADQTSYPENSNQNTVTALLAGGERIALPRETITLSTALLHSAVTGFAFDTQEITSPIPFTLQNIRASDEISSGLFTLTPAFTLSRYDFAGSGASANRIVPNETATLAYVPGSPLSLLLRLNALQLDYDRPAQNADIFEILAGAQEKQDGLWTFSALAGAAQRRERTGPGIIAPVLEARADWMPTPLDQISLTASREIDDPDAISSTPYIRSSIKLITSDEYLENVTLQTLVDLAEAQYIHSNLREFLATGELDMQWQATTAVALEGAYTFNTRQANMLSAANENVFTLGVIWTP